VSLAVVIEHSLEYSGQKDGDQSLPALEAAVMELMAPNLSRGYNFTGIHLQLSLSSWWRQTQMSWGQ